MLNEQTSFLKLRDKYIYAHNRPEKFFIFNNVTTTELICYWLQLEFPLIFVPWPYDDEFVRPLYTHRLDLVIRVQLKGNVPNPGDTNSADRKRPKSVYANFL